MKFDQLDQQMRVFETSADLCVLPGVYMVARLDGRSFTRLTKDVCKFERPYDVRFRDLMVATCESLMTCGFGVVFGYTQSDEISLLLAPDEKQFGRKLRKYHSVLAGEASAQFSVKLGQPATFDCRISQLPTIELVVDYFRWRNEDAARNALNSWCYWTLRKQDQNKRQATRRIMGLAKGDKNELMFQNGVNFNDLPKWQRRGVGLYWEEYEKVAINPVTNEEVTARRRRIFTDYELPMNSEYDVLIRTLISPSG